MIQNLGLRYRLISIGLGLMVGSCSSTQGSTPAASVDVVSQGRAHHQSARSWMDPAAPSEDLLYVSGLSGNVYVYSYPEGKLAGTLQGLNASAEGECVDAVGDVFITRADTGGAGTIYEYAHGGSSPIATLSDPGFANGCAIDPKTGTLAVTNIRDSNNPYYPYNGDVAIYAGAKGNPTIYYSHNPELASPFFCAYNTAGDLYLTAADNYGPNALLLRLVPKGKGSFDVINLNATLVGDPSVQSADGYVTVTSLASAMRHAPLSVYRLRISGSAATIEGTTQLTTKKNNYTGESWIQGPTILAASYYHKGYQQVSFWAYPAGGKPRRSIKRIGDIGDPGVWGLVVSPFSSLGGGSWR